MRRKGRLASLLRLGVIAATVAAVVQELRSPEAEREWNGVVAGFVPYDFRPPTPERIKQRMWNPDDERLFMPQVFGVGWGVNFGRLLRLLTGK